MIYVKFNITQIFLPYVPDSFTCHFICYLFSLKSTRGTRFTPAFQWPDNSLSFGVAQAVAWKKSGLMVKPSIQVR